MARLPTYTRTFQGDPDEFARTEWLLTNGLGGFAMGTALGVASRRYHGLLVASLRPPVQRVMALSSFAETLYSAPGTAAEQRFNFSCFRFRPGEYHPHGFTHLVKFEKDSTARWTYRLGAMTLVKTVAVAREANAVSVRWAVKGHDAPLRLALRPLVALRDFHALILRDTSRDRFRIEAGSQSVVVHSPGVALHIAADHAAFTRDEQWWHNFQYDVERDRGYDFLEDLFHPGFFVAELPAPTAEKPEVSVTLSASVAATTNSGAAALLSTLASRSADEEGKAWAAHLGKLVDATYAGIGPAAKPPASGPDAIAALVVAADDFVVRRQTAPTGHAPSPTPHNPPAAHPDAARASASDRYTIIAGYPWFADWGRDAMISLPGLLLTAGRLAEAKGVLLAFAAACGDGLVPNLFDDYTGEAHYNTVDASLWFVYAAHEYFRASRDEATFNRDLLPTCIEIVDAYRRGTHFRIRMDEADGLITAGDASTQLTWMDAKRDGVVFTPRQGKAVEINALWHHALACLVHSIDHRMPAKTAELAALRDRVAASFRARFWSTTLGPSGQWSGLYDTLAPGEGNTWIPQAEIRPNQLLAVSLRHSPLLPEQKSAVVKLVRERLLTPHGVRTLDPGNWRYKGRYRGRMFDRDAAYHNGIAWPWLLGPYAEAVLRAGSFSSESIAEAKAVLAPIIARLDGECPGQLAEVFDGDDTPGDPQKPGGCPAQAWSVAEALRVTVLIAKAEAGGKNL